MYRTSFGEHEKTHELYLNETELEWVEIAPAAKCLPDKGGQEYMIAEDALCTLDPLVAEVKHSGSGIIFLLRTAAISPHRILPVLYWMR